MLLEVNNLHVYYDSIHAIKGVNFKVEEGSIVTLIGANGAGKSSILKSISNLIPIKEGDIIFLGTSTLKYKAHDLVKLGISQVPEGRRVFPELTVLDNLAMGAYIQKNKKLFKEDLKTVFSYFPRLEERKNQVAGTLSGGEQQMLAMGRALMSHPKIMLLDEPSMGLAPILVDQIFNIIRKINQEGTTILLVEQNAKRALEISDYGYVLETGNIVAEGQAKDLLVDPKLIEAYLTT
ncbi:MAG: ABC transporter ATP-binding protein [Acholeplasmataceae bacterium]